MRDQHCTDDADVTWHNRRCEIPGRAFLEHVDGRRRDEITSCSLGRVNGQGTQAVTCEGLNTGREQVRASRAGHRVERVVGYSAERPGVGARGNRPGLAVEMLGQGADSPVVLLSLARGGAERDLMELNGWTCPQMLTRYGASARGARARRSYDRIMDQT